MQCLLAVLLLGALSVHTYGCDGAAGQNETGDVDEHEHDDEHGDDHADDEADDHGHEEENGESHAESVSLSEEQQRAYGVMVEPLAGGAITTRLTLPAEVAVNEDTLVHVTPRVAGIASEISAFLGEDVEAGESLVILDSPDLGEAKIELLRALREYGVATADLDRQRTITENTETLLDLLRTEPSLEGLQARSPTLQIGEDKGRLISAYARIRSSEANYLRESSLRERGLSTEADLLAAQEMYNSAIAEYMAIFEEIDFLYVIRLQETERAAAVARSSVENAQRRLSLFGLTTNEIEQIASEPSDAIARYEITSTLAGRIVWKHISPGERVGTEESIYMIADLSTVWLNIAVYERYQQLIRSGQKVTVQADGREATGQVTYIASAINESTRTVTARVVLANEKDQWRVGEFLMVQIETGDVTVDRRVPVDAIQQWEGSDIVFVREGGAFVPHPVTLGQRTRDFVEITSGDIPIGAQIVVSNSFLLKAELGKSAAGHDH